ncbi:hypothetical protein ABZ746_38915 [Streptomyces sp. NPDC020096]
MDRELGAANEQGFVDRFAAAWLANLDRRPTWLAERAGRVVGVLVLVVHAQVGGSVGIATPHRDWDHPRVRGEQ